MFKIYLKPYRFVHSIVTAATSTAMLTFILTAVNQSKEAKFPIDSWLKTWALVFILSSILSLFWPRVVTSLLRKIFNIENNE